MRDTLIPSARIGPGEVRWTGDDARGRWSLVAGARREPWDPGEPGDAAALPGAGLESRHALFADSASGRLAFDAQRELPIAYDNGMAGIVAPAESRNYIVITRAIIDDTALAFVSPLNPDDDIRFATWHGRVVSRDTPHVILSRTRSVRVEGHDG